MTFAPKPRSWLTSGGFNNTPWSRMVAPIIATTEVSFYREVRAKNTMGGFSGSSKGTAYLTTGCYVEIEEPGTYRGAGGDVSTTPLQLRRWVALVPIEALAGNPALVPQRGDIMEFTDALGRFRSEQIASTPDDPINAQTHVECVGDWFE